MFNVVFPSSLPASVAAAIAKALPPTEADKANLSSNYPGGNGARPKGDVDPVSMVDFDGQGQWKGGEPEEEQEEEEEGHPHFGGGPAGAQCAQQ